MTERPNTARPDSEGRPPVGSVAEEAAQLLAALTSLAHPGARGRGAAGTTGDENAHDPLHGTDERLAPGAPECAWCPLCQVIHAVRTTSPEVKAHLAVAASSLSQAAAALLAAGPAGSAPASPEESGVHRIDLDADPDEDPEGEWTDG